MTCEDIQELLSAFLDGEETHEESLRGRAHLERCDECRAMLEEWRAMETTIPIEEEAPVMDPRRRPRVLRPMRLLIAAALLAIGAGGSVLATVGAQDDLPPPADEVTEEPEDVVDDVVPTPSREPSPKPTTRPTPTAEPTERPPAGERGYARGTNGELMLLLALDDTAVEPGQRVRAGLLLRNITDHDVTFRSPVDSAMDLVIADPEGNEVYRRSRAEGWERETTLHTLEPGEEIAERIAFRAPRRGKYLVHAECLCFPEWFPEDPEDRPTATRTDKSGSSTKPFSTNEIRFVSYPMR